MKYTRLITLLAVLFIGFNAQAQDTVHKKNGEILKVVVKEINDTQIKYHHFDDPNEVLFTLERMLIKDIKFSYGKKYKEEAPVLTDEHFAGDADMGFSFNALGIASGALMLSFDKALSPSKSIHVTGKLFGMPIGGGADSDISGGGLQVGYRLKTGSLFKDKNSYRPDHLLGGGYVMPFIGYDQFREGYGSANYSRSRESTNFSFGLNFGKIKAVQNTLLIDYYIGFALFAGSSKSSSNYSDEVSSSPYIYAGDIFGGNNIGLSLGCRVGFLGGSYKSKEGKKKRKL